MNPSLSSILSLPNNNQFCLYNSHLAKHLWNSELSNYGAFGMFDIIKWFEGNPFGGVVINDENDVLIYVLFTKRENDMFLEAVYNYKDLDLDGQFQKIMLDVITAVLKSLKLPIANFDDAMYLDDMCPTITRVQPLKVMMQFQK